MQSYECEAMTDLTEDERELLRLLKAHQSAVGYGSRALATMHSDAILAHYRKAKEEGWDRGVEDALEDVPGSDEYASSIAIRANRLVNPFVVERSHLSKEKE